MLMPEISGACLPFTAALQGTATPAALASLRAAASSGAEPRRGLAVT
jgi:hypothetical protein